MTLKIDIISDVMCPWCIIGYSALQQALQDYPELKTKVQWHPFELNPDMPAEGQDLREHMAQKYGASEAQSKANRERIFQMGAELGFEFNYTEGQRILNTFKAHQLLSWAGELQDSDDYASDLQTQLKLALFSAYFQRGIDVSKAHELVKIAASLGLPEQEAKQILEQQHFAAAVRAEQQQWQQMGVSAVPAVVLANKYLISGGQPVEVFKQAIQQVLDEA